MYQYTRPAFTGSKLTINTSTVNFEQVIAGWDTVFHGVNQIINTNIYIFQVKLIGIISI